MLLAMAWPSSGGTALAAKDWVVYAKPPFGGAAQVLKYLARYTHRMAINSAAWQGRGARLARAQGRKGWPCHRARQPRRG
jgi:hypothetical protein